MYSILVCINSISISIGVKRQPNKGGRRAYAALQWFSKKNIITQHFSDAFKQWCEVKFGMQSPWLYWLL